jgi:hypothetical protein
MPRALPVLISLLMTPLAMATPKAEIAAGNIVITGVASPKNLTVVVAEGTEAEIADRPAMSGEWTAGTDRITFTPKYPLKPGTKYRVLGIDKGLNVQVPNAALAKPTIVTRILPTTQDIPENILRFYIEFNQPMPRGNVYDYVAIYTDKEKKIDWPFLRLEDELWNTDQTRLTLLIDPGRIKKEVKPRLDLGPVFMAGGKYTLVISGKWPTLDGGTLGKDVRKPIAAKPAIDKAVDPKTWKLSPPVDEAAALCVTFGRALDHQLLLRTLSVVDRDGHAVEGKAESTNDDGGWTFRPTPRWRAGAYNLRVETVLEDVCGNRVGQAFEVDVLRPTPKEIKVKHLDLPFTVGR